MTPFDNALAGYDRIHRNPWNRAFHAIGVPTIMTSLFGLTGLIQSPWPMVNGATAIILIAFLYILPKSVRAATGLALFSLVLSYGAQVLASYMSMMMAAIMFGAGFVIGWIIQFIGHAFERQPPEFVRSPINLLLGPLFVLNEVFRVLSFERGNQQ